MILSLIFVGLLKIPGLSQFIFIKKYELRVMHAQ